MAITTSGTTLTFNDATTQTTAPVNTNANVTSATAVAGTGISITAVTTTGAATHTVTNTGVTSAVAGRGITVSASTGAVTTSLAAGVPLQVVHFSYSTTESTTSTSFVATSLSGSITPSSTSSKILVFFNTLTSSSSAATAGLATVFRGTASGTNLATANANNYGFGGTYVSSGSAIQAVVSASVLDSPATASSQLYTVCIRSESGNSISASAGNSKSCLTLMEIAG